MRCRISILLLVCLSSLASAQSGLRRPTRRDTATVPIVTQRLNFADRRSINSGRRESSAAAGSSRRTRVMIGLAGGALGGGVIGFMRARKEIRKCRGQSCEAGPPLEIIVYPALYGAAGALAGGVIGWIWPRHDAADAAH